MKSIRPLELITCCVLSGTNWILRVLLENPKTVPELPLPDFIFNDPLFPSACTSACHVLHSKEETYTMILDFQPLKMWVTQTSLFKVDIPHVFYFSDKIPRDVYSRVCHSLTLSTWFHRIFLRISKYGDFITMIRKLRQCKR